MTEYHKEPMLTFALNKEEKMISINSIPLAQRGRLCNCHCPKCYKQLDAKLGQGFRQPHFAHENGSNCHGSYMTALHRLAEQIIEEEKAVMAPAYKESEGRKLRFTRVEVEQRVERKDLQPDIVGVTDDGMRWCIEIRNTHKIDDTKKAKLIESGITCLEIDISEQKLENLKSFLLESEENREWINNPNYESWIKDKKRWQVALVENFLINKRELYIPAYEKYDGKKIILNKISVISKTDDGLFDRAKAYSPDNSPYIFNIGCQELLDDHITLCEQKREYNELSIITDNLSYDVNFQPLNLKISWLYHLVSEKEQELKMREYGNNPKYEIKSKSFCDSQCKYRPYLGKCIYIIYQENGIVVCNKERRLKDEAKTKSENKIRSYHSAKDRFPREERPSTKRNLEEL